MKEKSKKKPEPKKYSAEEKPLTKQEYEALLRKVSQPVKKPEPKGS